MPDRVLDRASDGAPESATEPTPQAARPAPAGRRRIFLAAALAATLISVIGLAASTLVKSPEQVAADSRAPRASTLTAPVERRVLTSTVIARGTVAASKQVQVTPAGAVPAAGGDGRGTVAGTGAQGTAAQLLTGVHTAVGKTVQPGDVLLAVSGRPLIALQGAVPLYRDLRPGDTGDDVAMLQRALARLGHGRGGDEAGTFGPGTKAAVTRFYTRRGYRVPDTGGVGGVEDRERLRAAREAVTTARYAVDDMRRRMRAKPAVADPAGAVPLTVQLQRLERALSDARRAQAELVASTGPMVPVNEVVVLPAFPARVTQLSAQVGDVVRAPLLVLAVGRLGVTAQLQPDQGRLLKPGMEVRLTSELLGIEADARISAVGRVTAGVAGSASGGDPAQASADATGAGDTAAGGLAGGAPYVPVRITPRERLDDRWAGQDVRLTITSASTSKPVLVVPLSAVTSRADGRTTVSKAGGEGGGATTPVEVTAGMSGDGYVEVAPVDAGALVPGDRVVVAGE